MNKRFVAVLAVSLLSACGGGGGNAGTCHPATPCDGSPATSASTTAPSTNYQQTLPPTPAESSAQQ